MKIFAATTVALLAALNVLSVSAAGSCTTTTQLEANRKTAMALLDGVFNKRDVSAVDKYVGSKYLQHNPAAADGPETLKGLVQFLTNETKVEFGATAAVGDLVWVNTRYSGVSESASVGVDVFRFENGKAVEHWDIIQTEVPASKTASGRPMFPIQSELSSTSTPTKTTPAACGDGDSSACPPVDPQLEANTKAAVALLDGVFNKRDVSAVDKYIGTQYLQHNPQVPDGPSSLKDFAKLFTNETKVEFGATAAEGDLVWVNTRYSGLPGSNVSVALDVMRFENGKIVEHWDIIQVETPAAQTASGRPMFPIQGSA